MAKNIDEKEVVRLYRDDLLGIEKIRSFFKCSEYKIKDILDKNNINHNMSDRKKILFKRGKLKAHNKGKPNEIRRELNNSNNPMNDEKIRVKNSISQKLRCENGLSPIGNLGDYAKNGKYSGKKSPNYGIKRDEKTIKKLSESKTGKKNEKLSKVLRKLHKDNIISPHNKGKTMADYTPLMKCSLAQTGNKNHNWLGGISFDPYDKNFTKEFKLSILKRDNFCCLKCNKTAVQELMDFNRTLATHHINYDRLITIKENCCALCLRCNIEVNHKRIHWMKFFQSLLSEKYGYEYNSQNIIIKEVQT